MSKRGKMMIDRNDSLDKARIGLKEWRDRVARGEVSYVRNPVQKSKENPKSLKFAINAKCYDCTYDEKGAGNWKQQVENCGCPDCPLYSFRPVPKVRS